MVKVPVRVDRGANGQLWECGKRFQLKRRARGGLKSLDHDRRVAPNQEPAVAARLQPFRTICNRGIQAVADLSNRRKTLVGNWLLRDARVVGQSLRQCRNRRKFRTRIQRAQSRSSGKEASTRKRFRRIVHVDLHEILGGGYWFRRFRAISFW